MDYDRLRELQEKFEENPRRYFAPLANEYRKGGQPKRAIEICRAQLAQMPGHMSGQIVFGQALYEAGEFEEARQVFERALTLDAEVGAAPAPAAPQSAASQSAAQQSAAPEISMEPEPVAAPHFAARENTPAPPSPSLPEPEPTPVPQGAAPAEPPACLERHYPEVEPIPDVPLGTEGLHSHVVTPHMGAAALRSIIEA